MRPRSGSRRRRISERTQALDGRDVRQSVRESAQGVGRAARNRAPLRRRRSPRHRTRRRPRPKRLRRPLGFPSLMAKVTMIEAINRAHAWEMTHDPTVGVLGEDIGINGGVFRATAGLQEQFGKDRVQDTPLAEGMIAGMAIGMATQGLKPVAEIQFMGFIYPALDQIANHMARMRNRTRGRLTCPVVMRMPHGGGIHAPEHHSECLEAMLAHHAGLRVVCPSSPARAYGLLLAAIRAPDPVIFLEPVRLYRLARQEVADDGQALPLDVCFKLREGTDVTVVTWGAMTVETLKVAQELERDGVSCEVIDLATLSPIDPDTI